MSYTEEITTLEQQLTESDRQAQAAETVREKLAKLREAQRAEQEARDRAREAQAAAAALAAAEAEASRAQAAPLIEADAAFDAKLAALDEEITAYLKGCISDARGFHARRCALLDQRNVLRERIRACGETVCLGIRTPGFAEYVRSKLWDFSYNGRTPWAALGGEG